MSEIGILILIIALFVMWDFAKWGMGSGVYDSTKTDRMSGGGW